MNMKMNNNKRKVNMIIVKDSVDVTDLPPQRIVGQNGQNRVLVSILQNRTGCSNILVFLLHLTYCVLGNGTLGLNGSMCIGTQGVYLYGSSDPCNVSSDWFVLMSLSL